MRGIKQCMTPSLSRRFGVATIVLLAAALLPSAQAAVHLPPRLDPDVLEGPSQRAIVLFEGDVSDHTIRRLAQAGITHARVFPAIDAAAVFGPKDSYIEIARWRNVTWVEDDSPIQYHNEGARRDTNVTKVRAGRKPLRTGYSGEGVTVAVVDSGAESAHPDLTDRITTHLDMEPTVILDPIDDATYEERFAERPVGTDELGHGSHGIGIVGGDGGSAKGADLSGVAPKATLISCKLGQLPFESSALACYQWFLDHHDDERFPGGIRVTSNSWGTIDLSGERALELMIEKTVKARIAVVFSAGNAGKPGRDDVSAVAPYPNRMEEVLTVGAVCKSYGSRASECSPREVWEDSSRGPEIDLVAPGVDIWSIGVSGSHVQALRAGIDHVPGSPDPVTMLHNHAFYANLS